MGRSVTKDVTKSWSWEFLGIYGNIPALEDPDIMLESAKVFRIA
jgi:hypothetical protein